MVKLYRFDKEKEDWVFFDYGVKNLIDVYLAQGYIVHHIYPKPYRR